MKFEGTCERATVASKRQCTSSTVTVQGHNEWTRCFMCEVNIRPTLQTQLEYKPTREQLVHYCIQTVSLKCLAFTILCTTFDHSKYLTEQVQPFRVFDAPSLLTLGGCS